MRRLPSAASGGARRCRWTPGRRCVRRVSSGHCVLRSRSLVPASRCRACQRIVCCSISGHRRQTLRIVRSWSSSMAERSWRAERSRTTTARIWRTGVSCTSTFNTGSAVSASSSSPTSPAIAWPRAAMSAFWIRSLRSSGSARTSPPSAATRTTSPCLANRRARSVSRTCWRSKPRAACLPERCSRVRVLPIPSAASEPHAWRNKNSN